jgi:hypothetical protein
MTPPKTPASARAEFVKAMRAYAAGQPDHGDKKQFGFAGGNYSLNDIANEMERGTKIGDEFYAALKDVLRFAPSPPPSKIPAEIQEVYKNRPKEQGPRWPR